MEREAAGLSAREHEKAENIATKLRAMLGCDVEVWIRYEVRLFGNGGMIALSPDDADQMIRLVDKPTRRPLPAPRGSSTGGGA